MKWEHKCNLEWLKGRQKYLCASDIKRLIPFTKTGRDRRITIEDYLSVWASKQKILTEADCISTGAAARGHLLEPYAIKAFNDYAISKRLGVELYHWDDVVINRDDYLAYSPDAINIPQLEKLINIEADQSFKKIIGEIKCYDTEKHIKTMFTPNEKREERWQIATAMAVEEGIEKAYLILFNPGVKELNLGVYEYTREDLKEEIETIFKIESNWIKFLNDTSFINEEHICSTTLTESQIIEQIERENRFNVS